MKKLIAIMLCFAMLMSLGLTAFAATPPDPAQGDVNVNILGTSGADAENIVYSITVNWDNLTAFEYTKGQWNPSSLAYDAGTWTSGDATNGPSKNVVITNKSNAAVVYDANFSNNAATSAAQGGVTAAITEKDNGTIASAEDGTERTATLPVKVTGTPSGNANFKVDTITISFSAAP